MTKKIKKLVTSMLLGILTLGSALSLVAWTGSEETPKAIRNHVYVLDPEENMYVKASSDGTLPPGDCVEEQNLPPCHISFDTDQGTDFSPSAIPPGGEASPTNGYWD